MMGSVVKKRNHIYLRTEKLPEPVIEICEQGEDACEIVRLPVEFVDSLIKALDEARDQLAKG